MTYSTSHPCETQFIDNHLTLFEGGYNTAASYEEQFSLSDAISHLFTPNSPPQEEFSYGSTLPYKEEIDFTSRPWGMNKPTEEANEGQQPPYNGCGSWLSEYDTCFGGCWGDNFFSHSYNNHDNGLQKKENTYQNEEQCAGYISYNEDGYISYNDDAEYQLPDCNPWSSYGSWFGQGGEEDFFDYIWREPEVACNDSADEMGIWEGFFGYWPCLSWKDQKT